MRSSNLALAIFNIYGVFTNKVP